jgi:hypothetical protein
MNRGSWLSTPLRARRLEAGLTNRQRLLASKGRYRPSVGDCRYFSYGGVGETEADEPGSDPNEDTCSVRTSARECCFQSTVPTLGGKTCIDIRRRKRVGPQRRFAAWGLPALFVDEVRTFFRLVR